MSRFTRPGWIRGGLLAFALSCLGIVGTGCGSKVEEKTLTTDEAPEVQDANNAMQDFMKSNPSGKTQP